MKDRVSSAYLPEHQAGFFYFGLIDKWGWNGSGVVPAAKHRIFKNLLVDVSSKVTKSATVHQIFNKLLPDVYQLVQFFQKYIGFSITSRPM